MKNLEKEVKAINTQLKALIKKTDALIKAAGAASTPAKPKTILRKKKATVKKAAPKSTRKTTAKSTAKKPRHSSSTELALKIIRQHKKGIDVETLQKKTRFDEKKISNIVHRAFKKGLIKRAGRGIYKI